MLEQDAAFVHGVHGMRLVLPGQNAQTEWVNTKPTAIDSRAPCIITGCTYTIARNAAAVHTTAVTPSAHTTVQSLDTTDVCHIHS
jgi:hypothetical protein